jgi:hypothetical protein
MNVTVPLVLLTDFVCSLPTYTCLTEIRISGALLGTLTLLVTKRALGVFIMLELGSRNAVATRATTHLLWFVKKIDSTVGQGLQVDTPNYDKSL